MVFGSNINTILLRICSRPLDARPLGADSLDALPLALSAGSLDALPLALDAGSLDALPLALDAGSLDALPLCSLSLLVGDCGVKRIRFLGCSSSMS
jgi:hypothetical protein